MSTTRRLVDRVGGEYRDSSGWTFNARTSIAAIKASASRVTGTLTLNASRTTCLINSHILFNATTTMPTTNSWYRDVEFTFFYDDEGSSFHMMDTTEHVDKLGRSAEMSHGYRGSHVWESAGTKTVTCFAYNTSNNTWDEQTITITVQDTLDFFLPADRYIVAADGDYTGAPEADNFYTDYLSAISASQVADRDSLILVKRGQTYPVSGITNGIFFSQDDANWHIDAWGEGELPKIICDFGASPQGSGAAVLHVLLRCESFTLANLHFKGLYNSTTSDQMVEGELVLSGTSGGDGNSMDAEIIFVGWGGTATTPTPTHNVTMYGCKVERVSKAMYASAGNYTSVYNCNIKEWSDYGVFHSFVRGFSMVGNTAKVKTDCLHLGQGKNYGAVPRDPFHGPLRSEQSVNALIYNNDVYAKNGWFSTDTCQPPLRIHTDGARQSSPNISVICSRNISSNGDGPMIFVPANPSVPSQFTDDALLEGNVLIGQQHQYDATKISQACVFRNNLLIQEDVVRESPNDVWQGVLLTQNGGSTNGSDMTIFDQDIYVYCNTILNYLSVQSSDPRSRWAGVVNADQFLSDTPAYAGAYEGNNLTYAPNLNPTEENQIDPVFDSYYVPSSPTFTNTDTRPLGAALDIYGNLRPSNCNLGAIQAPPQD